MLFKEEASCRSTKSFSLARSRVLSEHVRLLIMDATSGRLFRQTLGVNYYSWTRAMILVFTDTCDYASLGFVVAHANFDPPATCWMKST